MIENIYRVPQPNWKRWSNRARAVFNDLYDRMVHSQWAFVNGEYPVIADENWKVISWNAAWMAADSVDKVKEVELVNG